jgi:hypothetical protein
MSAREALRGGSLEETGRAMLAVDCGEKLVRSWEKKSDQGILI